MDRCYKAVAAEINLRGYGTESYAGFIFKLKKTIDYEMDSYKCLDHRIGI
jgi:hypothetical protein